MNRRLRKILCLFTACCLTAGSVWTALAADVFYTSARVNFRADASTDARVIKTLNKGASVEMLNYDPGNWSLVSVNGTAGYIKSEYLIASAAYKTTSRVNFRTGPSTGAAVIKVISAGTVVEMLEYDPDGWSKVKIGNSAGYIKSEYLTKTDQPAAPSEPKPEPSPEPSPGTDTDTDTESPAAFRTTGRVNFRTDPSTDADVIKLLNPGTAVEMLEHDPDGWSKVSADGKTGYIKSEYLTEAGNFEAELLEWAAVKNLLKTYTPIQIIDVRTGLTYNMQSFSNGLHADVEPLTKEDTEILKKTFNNKWQWVTRPVLAIINGRTIAASINGMPHGGGTISNNGMNGQVCLHFLGSKMHNGNTSFERSHQADVMEAWTAR